MVAVLCNRADPVAHTRDSASGNGKCKSIATRDDCEDSSDHYSNNGDGEMKSVFCGGHALTVASDLAIRR